MLWLLRCGLLWVGFCRLCCALVFPPLKCSRLKPPAFLLKANHLIQSSGLARLCGKKYLVSAASREDFFSQTPCGLGLVQPNGLFRNFGTKRLIEILITCSALSGFIYTCPDFVRAGAVRGNGERASSRAICYATLQAGRMQGIRGKGYGTMRGTGVGGLGTRLWGGLL